MNLHKFYVRLFGERDTIDEALEYALLIAKASDNPAAVMTAVHVVLNTAIRLTKEQPQ